MSLSKERIAKAKELIEQHPSKKKGIIDLYQLMENEISDGASPDDELEKFLADVKQLTD